MRILEAIESVRWEAVRIVERELQGCSLSWVSIDMRRAVLSTGARLPDREVEITVQVRDTDYVEDVLERVAEQARIIKDERLDYA